jgi:hypothetical protein
MFHRIFIILLCLFSSSVFGNYYFNVQPKGIGVKLVDCRVPDGSLCTDIVIPETYNGDTVVAVEHANGYGSWHYNVGYGHMLTSVTVAASIPLQPVYLFNPEVDTTFFFLGDRDKLLTLSANSDGIAAIYYCPGRVGWPGEDYDGITPQPDLTCDSDNDGVVNIDDSFPFDSNETIDSDSDGIGNNADEDDDNDGIMDDYDFAPLDSAIWITPTNFTYNIIDEALSSIELTGCLGDCPQFLFIPEFYDDYFVRGIADYAFFDINIPTVIIPKTVNQIGEGAFVSSLVDNIYFLGDRPTLASNAFHANALQNIYYCQNTNFWPGDAILGTELISPELDVSCTAPLQKQTVSVMGEPTGMLGEDVLISVNYDTSDNNSNLTGLGFRMHFNSSELTFLGFDSLLETSNILALNLQDSSNFDNDEFTDSYISLSWASAYLDWPGNLPEELFSARFEVADDEALEVSQINFSSISTAVGYELESQPYDLQIIPVSWDFDKNGVLDALTDGILLLRYAFGLRNNALTDYVIAVDSPISATEVEDYLDKVVPMADIDGNGAVDALTDGLLLLRYAFEGRGDSLINNVISPDANRTSAADIEAYIESHMP